MISEELKNIFSGKKRDRYIETIEIFHEESQTSFFFVKYPQELELYTETNEKKAFLPANFILKLPTFEENGNLEFTIAFSNVNWSYISTLETILRTYNEPIEFRYRLYVESALKYPQMQAPFKFSATGINIANRSVTFKGSLLINIQKNIPDLKFEYTNFNGLKYVK